MRVAVIGAGAAGLVAARALIREGHDVRVVEASDRVGGVWVYTSEVEDDELGVSPSKRVRGSLYDSLRTNLPRDLMAFSDYPFDSSGGGSDDWPRFVHHPQVLEYLERFAADHGLLDRIGFDQGVRRVERAASHWRIDLDQGDSFDTDAVAVCNGHYNVPHVPDLPGAEKFPGVRLHSHNYREPSRFAGRRVALLGASASALDLSREIATVAEEVYWCGPLRGELPPDLPRMDNLVVGPSVRALGPDGSIELEGGHSIPPVDDFVYCTGFEYAFPFLPGAHGDVDVNDSDAGSWVRVRDHFVEGLYRQLIPVAEPTLGFIGLPFQVVPFRVFEVQAIWFARLLADRFSLPSVEARREANRNEIRALEAAGVPRRHFHELGQKQIEYCDGLAAQCGLDPLPAWFGQMWDAHRANIAADPRGFRDRPLPIYGPTIVPGRKAADQNS